MDYVDRDHAGQRRFSDRDLDWLGLIGRLRSTGMSVSDMVGYAEIADLQATLVVLDGKIATYEGNSAGGAQPEGMEQP